MSLKWTFVGLPIVILLITGFITYAVQSNSVDQSGTVLSSNPISFLLGGINVPSGQSIVTSVGNALSSAWNSFVNWISPSPVNNAPPSPAFGISLVGTGMILFAILGNIQVAGSGLNLSDSTTRLLVAMGLGYLIYGWVSGYATLLYTIPYGIGNILFLVLTIIYSVGLYDLGRSII